MAKNNPDTYADQAMAAIQTKAEDLLGASHLVAGSMVVAKTMQERDLAQSKLERTTALAQRLVDSLTHCLGGLSLDPGIKEDAAVLRALYDARRAGLSVDVHPYQSLEQFVGQEPRT
jgi:hypothetical protein